MNKAVEIYTAIPKMHNCAQAVVCGFGHDELNAEMALCGGGKAPEGMCGALYGALQLIPADKHEAAVAEFRNALGNTGCKELKSHPVPCATCVATAAEIVEKYLG